MDIISKIIILGTILACLAIAGAGYIDGEPFATAEYSAPCQELSK